MVTMTSRSKKSKNITADDQSVNSADSSRSKATNGSNSGDEALSPAALKLKLQRLQRDAARHREKYKNETEEQRKRRRERDALRHKEAYREKQMQKRLERLESVYATKEPAVPAEAPTSLAPFFGITGSSPPTKRSKGRSASLPNFSNLASQVNSAFKGYQDRPSRRSSGTAVSSDSEDVRSQYTYNNGYPHSGPSSTSTSLNSATFAASFHNAMFLAPPTNSDHPDLSFGDDDALHADSSFMDSFFEGYDDTMLPLDTQDLLDQIALDEVETSPHDTNCAEGASGSGKTGGISASHSTDTIESQSPRMLMPQSGYHLPEVVTSGRTTRSSSCPPFYYAPSTTCESSSSKADTTSNSTTTSIAASLMCAPDGIASVMASASLTTQVSPSIPIPIQFVPFVPCTHMLIPEIQSNASIFSGSEDTSGKDDVMQPKP